MEIHEYRRKNRIYKRFDGQDGYNSPASLSRQNERDDAESVAVEGGQSNEDITGIVAVPTTRMTVQDSGDRQIFDICIYAGNARILNKSGKSVEVNAPVTVKRFEIHTCYEI